MTSLFQLFTLNAAGQDFAVNSFFPIPVNPALAGVRLIVQGAEPLALGFKMTNPAEILIRF